LNNPNYIRSLDGVRFLAVTMVLADHWSGDRLGFPASYLGVCMFFVLSGFLITGILMEARKKDEALGRGHGFSLKQFYIRRTLRIFPLYYLVLLILFVLNVEKVRDKIVWLATYMTNNYMAVYHRWMGSVDHLWSLAVEEQFYLFFPFLILFLPFRSIKGTLMFFVPLAVGLRLFLFLNTPESESSWISSYVLMPTCLDAFGLGALLAYWRKTGSKTMDSIFKNNAFLILSLVIYAIVVFLYRYQIGTDIQNGQPSGHNFYDRVLLRLAEALFSVFLIGRLLHLKDDGMVSKSFRMLFENKFAIYVGKVSYGMYLLHNFVFNNYHTPDGHPTRVILNYLNGVIPGFEAMIFLKVLLLYFITLGLASLSWIIIEKPVNKLKDKFGY
jgi:peptidoglycan/LPS O-acetylase OafA/YrhL